MNGHLAKIICLYIDNAFCPVAFKVTIDGVLIVNRIYCIYSKLVTTLHILLHVILSLLSTLQPLVSVARYRLPTANFPLTVCFSNRSGLYYQVQNTFSLLQFTDLCPLYNCSFSGICLKVLWMPSALVPFQAYSGVSPFLHSESWTVNASDWPRLPSPWLRCRND
jgi:hypothetical protein